MTIFELREKRVAAWNNAKSFLDAHRKENGVLSAEDDAKYTQMEQEITDLGKEIARLERQEQIEAELQKSANSPILTAPQAKNPDFKSGRASDEYNAKFWDMMRSKVATPQIINALTVGTDSEGGYLVPDEFEKVLVEALEEETVMRKLAKVIRTSSGTRKIPVVATAGTASWIEEEGTYPETEGSFNQVSLDAYKAGAIIKISEELMNDSAFNMQSYISKEFARRIGNLEEEAFIKGDGSNKPTGILADAGGADVGVTAAGEAAITGDEIMDLFYSLKSPYRRKAVWLLNDNTIKLIRKLKDGQGQYLWQPSLQLNTPDMLLGRPVYTSAFMPTAAASAKTIAFGDFSYYWIADRQSRAFKPLYELYATTGHIGYLSSERVDGKLVLAEAIKVLQMKGGV